MQRRSPLVVAAVLAVVAPGSARAQDVVATGVAGPRISALGDALVWTSLDPATRTHTLMLTGAHGTSATGLAGAAAPFDVDLGLGPSGERWAVYSSCAAPDDPPPRCTIDHYDLDSGATGPIGAPQDPACSVLYPTVHRDRIAFGRWCPGRRPRIVQTSVTGGPEVITAVVPPVGGNAPLRALELGAQGLLSIEVRPCPEDCNASLVMRLISRTGRARALADIRPGEGDGLNLTSPTLHGDHALGLVAASEGRGGILFRTDLRGRVLWAAQLPAAMITSTGPIAFAAFGARALLLHGSVLCCSNPCLAHGGSPSSPPTAICTITASRTPALRRVGWCHDPDRPAVGICDPADPRTYTGTVAGGGVVHASWFLRERQLRSDFSDLRLRCRDGRSIRLSPGSAKPATVRRGRFSSGRPALDEVAVSGRITPKRIRGRLTYATRRGARVRCSADLRFDARRN